MRLGMCMPLTIQPDVVHQACDFEIDDWRVPALWRMEEKHFWHAARNAWIIKALAQYLPTASGKVLDVGCGSGAVARALATAGYEVSGVDTAERLVRRAHIRVPQAHFVCGDVACLPASRRGPFDAIGFFDVLEHLEEPNTLIETALRYARSGTLVIATVPAQQRLFSIIDHLTGHKRRYDASELAMLLRRVGLDNTHEHGIFRFLVPFIHAARSPASYQTTSSRPTFKQTSELMTRNLRVPATPINAVFRAICALECRYFLQSEGKTGATLLAVGYVP